MPNVIQGPGPLKNLALAILTTITTGLCMTIYGIFTEKIPAIERKVEVLRSENTQQERYLQRIDERTQKIYEILLDKR